MERSKKKKALLGAGLALVIAGGGAWLGVNAATADDPPEDLLGQTAEVDAQGTDIEVTGDGDVVKTPGEAAELIDADTEAVMFSLTVSDVQVLDTCAGRTDKDVTPVNGHFVAFTIDASMAASIEEVADNEEEVFLPLLAEAFEVTDADGNPVGGGTEASWLCFEPDALAPAFVGPGESATGLVVLDSAVDTGFISYAPDSQDGWAWAF